MPLRRILQRAPGQDLHSARMHGFQFNVRDGFIWRGCGAHLDDEKMFFLVDGRHRRPFAVE